jgi:hypothetical protein
MAVNLNQLPTAACIDGSFTATTQVTDSISAPSDIGYPEKGATLE